MRTELQEYLFRKYPIIFEYHTLSIRESCMARGIETGDGWFNLLDRLCNSITNHIKDQHLMVKWAEDNNAKNQAINLVHPPLRMEFVRFNQVKEKMGSLTIYYEGGDDAIRGMIKFAKDMSRYICEDCGIFDNTVGVTTKNRIRSICETCISENIDWKTEENGWTILTKI